MGPRLLNLLALGEPNFSLAEIIHTVPLSQESITEDGKRANWLGEVHAHETADARSLDFKDVVVGADGEVKAGEGEAEVGKRITLVALDGVLSIERLLGTNLLVPVVEHDVS